jgi:hypothetical protein
MPHKQDGATATVSVQANGNRNNATPGEHLHPQYQGGDSNAWRGVIRSGDKGADQNRSVMTLAVTRDLVLLD